MAYDKVIDSSILDNALTSVADTIRTKGGTSDQLVFPLDFNRAINAIDTKKPEQEKTLSIIENGSIDVLPDPGKVIKKVILNVNVPSQQKPEETKSVTYTTNGDKVVTASEGKVMTTVNVKVAVPNPPPVIESKTINENGTYNAPSGVDGYSPVIVNCPEPKPEQQKTVTITTSGDTEILPDPGKVLSKATASVDVYSYDNFVDEVVNQSSTVVTSGATEIPNYAEDTNNVFYYNKLITNADFPQVTSIGTSAFSYCSSLTTINFPQVKSIGGYAFYGCSALTTVNFPSATSIGIGAFWICVSLTTIDIPLAATIDRNAFWQCSALTTINLPSATSIGESAFTNCYSLAELNLTGSNFCKAIGNPYIPSGCTIYVPSALIDQYKSATNWSRYASQFVAKDA